MPLCGGTADLQVCRPFCVVVASGTRPEWQFCKPLRICRSAGLFSLHAVAGSSEHQWQPFKQLHARRFADLLILLLSVVLGLNGSLVNHSRPASLQGCFHSRQCLLWTSVAAVQAMTCPQVCRSAFIIVVSSTRPEWQFCKPLQTCKFAGLFSLLAVPPVDMR